MYSVECSDLSKKYKDTCVLKDITIKLEENKIYGLLGRNGAGKTTFLNIVSGLIFNTSGEIKVYGEGHFENDKILSKICFIRDRMVFMSNMKVKKIFDIASDFFENWDEAFKDELVDKFQLDINKKYRTLSKGMESMVGIIIGLASRCPLTIFDEAYLGLDAAARQLFYDVLLEDYAENPRTIIFSTHLIDEVSNLFEEIIIIHKGKILLQEDIDSINEKSFVVTGNEALINTELSSKNVINIQQFGNSKKAFIYDSISPKEIKTLMGKGIDIRPMALQEMFIQITQR